jgi:hypothetical protein
MEGRRRKERRSEDVARRSQFGCAEGSAAAPRPVSVLGTRSSTRQSRFYFRADRASALDRQIYVKFGPSFM